MLSVLMVYLQQFQSIKKPHLKIPGQQWEQALEIYDYLRLLYAKIGVPYCPETNEPLVKQTIEEMTDKIMELKEGSRIMVISPLIREEGVIKRF